MQRIPKKFYKHLPTILPKRASLTTQSCKIWRVNVHQNEEGICFSRGWSEFVKAHDLQLGYFLLFRYERKMVFSVKVFDTSCCLKDYALTPCEPKQPTFEYSKVVDLTFDVKSEVYSCDAQIPVVSGKKRKHASGKARLVCEEDGEEGEPILKIRGKKKKIQKSSPTVPKFEKTLSPSSTTANRKSLAIPKRFCVENGLVSKQAIFLMNSKGNKWQVKILIRQYKADLTTGWSCFSKENELKEGDTCIFQLINRNTFLVNVMPHVKSWRGEKQQTDPVTECERTIANYNIRYMNFPKTFCQKNGLTSNRTMKLKDSEKHEWTLNFYYNNIDGRLISGWSNFFKENGLKKGDKLKFMVVAHDTMLFCRARGQGTSRKSDG
ncbi:Transcriptional factor B3 family protein [Rhynchospora pubera]|uniref:Transcriptional factor B3 family protein n=1 Tax=Rhynchospora pubera TaxID=906938 RepID=A0AAV8CJ52_9POAL|nr:Transcriptional factor B3 family protein [Rhynchospora pubera]